MKRLEVQRCRVIALTVLEKQLGQSARQHAEMRTGILDDAFVQNRTMGKQDPPGRLDPPADRCA